MLLATLSRQWIFPLSSGHAFRMNSFPVLPSVSIARQLGVLKLHLTHPIPSHPMNTTQYPLDQSSALFISGLLSAGHEESADSLPPMEDGPRFPYSAIRGKVNGYAPPVPRDYVPAYDSEETPDLDEDDGEELESLLRSFARDKQGREYSGDILPSMRTRGAIRSELASMGCVWGE